MTLDEMNNRVDLLHLLMPSIKKIIIEQLLCKEQVELLETFSIELLAYQDAESCFYNHISFMENE